MRILLLASCAKLNKSFLQVLLAEQYSVVQQVGLEGAATGADHGFDLVLLDGALTLDLSPDDLFQLPALRGRPMILLYKATDQLLNSAFRQLPNVRCYLQPLTAAQLLHEVAYQETRQCTAADTTTIILADLHLNVYLKSATRAGKLLKLTRNEFQLLKILLLQKNKLVLRTNIILQLWGVITEQRQKSLNSSIALLRKKLDEGCAQKLLHTISRQGYMLKAE